MSLAAYVHAVDFGRGVHPLARAFQSVAIFVTADEGGRTTGPDIESLERWLVEWDDWFRRVSGLEEGRRLHLLYRREVAIATAIRTRQWEALRGIALLCRARGVGWAITLDARDAVRNLERAKAMFAERLLHGVALSFDGDSPLPERALELATCALEAGTRVTLSGRMQAIVEGGLMSAGGLNGRHVTVEPTMPEALRDTLDRGEPCFRRFRVLVDAGGNVYPCAGLLGMPECRLGSIGEPFEASAFGTGVSPLDLHALASQGPDVAGMGDVPPSSLGLPHICARHRILLRQGAAPGNL